MVINPFSKRKIPNRLPSSMQTEVDRIAKCKSKEAALKCAYDLLTKKYRGYRVKTYVLLPDAFIDDIGKIWQKSGFLHCTNLNWLLKILLVKSGHFKISDIKEKRTLVWYISPHQYLDVSVSKNKVVHVDVWSKAYGIPFGDYAHGFH